MSCVCCTAMIVNAFWRLHECFCEGSGAMYACVSCADMPRDGQDGIKSDRPARWFPSDAVEKEVQVGLEEDFYTLDLITLRSTARIRRYGRDSSGGTISCAHAWRNWHIKISQDHCEALSFA